MSVAVAGTPALAHAVVAPIVLPLMLGAVLVLLERRGSRWVAPLSLAGIAALFVLALHLLVLAHGLDQPLPYLMGNWAAPFGIGLVLDRLAALMLLLAAFVAGASLLYALGGDARRGPHFHSLMQFQLMGLNGAFLTGDLFNLFVFFEVLLIASYGLLLHGAGAARLRASVHYVAFNLTGSTLFLIAVSLLYALTGTLNMADLAERVPRVAADRTLLVQSAALLLLVVFGVKAALLPLFFWLPATYGAASAPVAALFAVMTKVGIYAILRMTTLVFGAEGGPAAAVASPWFETLALATLALGAVGALAAQHLRGLVGNLVVASAGTLLLSVALARPATVAAGLFYLVHTTLVAAALFLLADRVRHARQQHGSADDKLQPAEMGTARGGLAVLFFFLAVAAASLPPLGGFLGKAMLLQAAGPLAWGGITVAVVLASSLLVMVALSMGGSTVFWQPAPGAGGASLASGTSAVPASTADAAASAAPAAAFAALARFAAATPPQPDTAEQALPDHAAHRLALALLLAAVLGCALLAGPLARYTEATAAQLFAPRAYREAVFAARPAPPAWDVRREMRERAQAASAPARGDEAAARSSASGASGPSASPGSPGSPGSRERP